MLFMKSDQIPTSEGTYLIPTYAPQLTMMSVQKGMVPEGCLIRHQTCGLDNGPKVWYFFVRGLPSKIEFGRFRDILTSGTVLHILGTTTCHREFTYFEVPN